MTGPKRSLALRQAFRDSARAMDSFYWLAGTHLALLHGLISESLARLAGLREDVMSKNGSSLRCRQCRTTNTEQAFRILFKFRGNVRRDGRLDVRSMRRME